MEARAPYSRLLSFLIAFLFMAILVQNDSAQGDDPRNLQMNIQQFKSRVQYDLPVTSNRHIYFCADGTKEEHAAPKFLTPDQIDEVCAKIVGPVYEYICQSQLVGSQDQIRFSTYLRSLSFTNDPRSSAVPKHLFWFTGDFSGWIFDWVKSETEPGSEPIFYPEDPEYDGDRQISVGPLPGRDEFLKATFSVDTNDLAQIPSLTVELQNLRHPHQSKTIFLGHCLANPAAARKED
jgi:hypothetical protein